ncbi:hypothetical protein KAR91_73410 [Candidatus Pacearchaeota archaeon]|nr:hypothetical protein [Candidatus Pacearchaeota archaeon]
MMTEAQSIVGRRSRRKGKAFECWCAREFTRCTGLKWSSTRNSGRTDLKGDIYCVEYPNLPLIVECKHDKRYSVHGMLKPVDAFLKMYWGVIENARKCSSASTLVFLVKNETGVWFSIIPLYNNTKSISLGIKHGAPRIIINGVIWYKFVDVFSFDFGSVCFDARRMESASKKRKKVKKRT